MTILCIIGPTASGKSARAVESALAQGGEVISVDSRQVYRTLDIGTEKISHEEARGVPHHLIDIRDPEESYSAGDFVADATRLIGEIHARGKLPILVGGTHFYFDALINGLPASVPPNPALRRELAAVPYMELYEMVKKKDPRRAKELDPNNRRRLVRALEIIDALGTVPTRVAHKKIIDPEMEITWVAVNPPPAELKQRIEARLKAALARGLVEEVRRVQERVGEARLREFGLEYKVVGEHLRGERAEASLLPALSAKLWQYARNQKAWLKKLTSP